MRVALLLGMTAAVALAAGPARADDPVPAVTAPPALPPPPPGPQVVAPPGVFIGDPGEMADGRTTIALDLILGMQTGARLQGVVHQAAHRVFVAEGFYGALFSKLGSSEAAGVGGRVLFRRVGRDDCHAMLLGPGVNMFYQFHDDAQWILAPSLDLAWLRSIGDFGAGWQVGINAGLGVSVSGRERGGDAVTPIISIFTGFRF
jgi:hypothetical protein